MSCKLISHSLVQDILIGRTLIFEVLLDAWCNSLLNPQDSDLAFLIANISFDLFIEFLKHILRIIKFLQDYYFLSFAGVYYAQQI